MEAWKKTKQAIEMSTDYPVKGKMRRNVNRIVRAKLKVKLEKEKKEAFDSLVEKMKFEKKLSF